MTTRQTRTSRGSRLSPPAPAGQKPGYNAQAERVYLYALYLVDDDMFAQWAGVTDAGDFDEPKHQTFFEALSDLHGRGTPRDSATVYAWLSERRLLHDWPNWESELLGEDVKWTRIASYARTVIDNGILRETRRVSQQLLQGAITREEAARRLEYLDARTADLDSHTKRPPQIAGVLAVDVQTQPVRWLWPGYLALGKLAIIDGDPGQGKGLLSIDLAARLTRGWPMPGMLDGSQNGIAPLAGNVVLLTPEDDPADTIRPRLDAAGADVARVRLLRYVEQEDGSLRSLTIPRDVPLIEAAIRHDNARALFIDPITGCLDAGVRTNVDSEVRAALLPLDDMVRRLVCSGVLVRHFNKGDGGGNALYRGGGSIAFSAACRTTFVVGPHPDAAGDGGEDVHVFAPVKNNLRKLAPSLAYTITADAPDAWPHIAWDREPCDVQANDLLTVRKSQQARDIVHVLRDAAPKALTPVEVAADLGISAKDTVGQAAIRQRLSRMAKHRQIASPAYGLYTTLSPTHT